MRKALLIVDVQNDFLPGGALEVEDGDEIIPVIEELAGKFDTVIATQDYHPKGHFSFASAHGKEAGDIIELEEFEQILWPDHCIQGTHGCDFHPTLKKLDVDKVIQKGCDINIDSYSAFFDNDRQSQTDLDQFLNGEEIHHLAIVGLATDYCVKYSVLDALDLGYNVSLILEGCRAVNFDPEDEEEAIREMAAAGAKIIV